MIIVLDTETTGLDPKRHALIAIGAVALDPDTLETVSEFSAFLSPREGSEWTPEAEAVNGIARTSLALEDTEEIVIPAFLRWAGGRCTATVGWNLKFDLGFLCGALKRLEQHDGCILCANALDARDAWWEAEKQGFLTSRPKSLNAALELIERSRSGEYHGALEDARLTSIIFRYVREACR
jgi:DNA polymerase III epsilon subunit-like protein